MQTWPEFQSGFTTLPFPNALGSATQGSVSQWMQILHANYSPDIWGQIWMAGSPTKELANLGVGVTEVTGQSQKTISNFAFLTIPSRGLKTFNCRGTVHSPHHTARPVVSSTGFPLHRVETAGRRKSRGDCEPCNFRKTLL